MKLFQSPLSRPAQEHHQILLEWYTPVKPCRMVGHSPLGSGQALGLSPMESCSCAMPLTMIAAAFALDFARCLALSLLSSQSCQRTVIAMSTLASRAAYL